METNFIQYQNSKIFYKTTGQGMPVIFVHGFAEDGNIWKQQIDSLKGHYRLIVPDLPGSGKSDFLSNANIEIFAEIIKTIIDKESKDEKVVLFGHSMGGYITLALAEKYPELLKAFGLIHSSAFADSDEKKLARKKSIDFIRANGAASFLKTAIPGLFTEQFNKYHKELVEALIEEGKNFTDASLIQYYEAMIERPDRIAVLQKVNFPVLFVIGEFDQAVPLQASLQQCHIPKISVVSIFKDSAHMSMMEETEKLNLQLTDFLTTIS